MEKDIEKLLLKYGITKKLAENLADFEEFRLEEYFKFETLSRSFSLDNNSIYTHKFKIILNKNGRNLDNFFINQYELFSELTNHEFHYIIETSDDGYQIVTYKISRPN